MRRETKVELELHFFSTAPSLIVIVNVVVTCVSELPDTLVYDAGPWANRIRCLFFHVHRILPLEMATLAVLFLTYEVTGYAVFKGGVSHGAEKAANKPIAKSATLHSPGEGESESGDFGARHGRRLLCCASEGGHVGRHARCVWKCCLLGSQICA